jgi:hypothetical protein
MTSTTRPAASSPAPSSGRPRHSLRVLDRLARLRAEMRAVEPGTALPRLSAYPLHRVAPDHTARSHS